MTQLTKRKKRKWKSATLTAVETALFKGGMITPVLNQIEAYIITLQSEHYCCV